MSKQTDPAREQAELLRLREKERKSLAFLKYMPVIIVVLAAIRGMNPILLALCNGIMYGGLWSFSDLLFLVVPSESAPTQIRATVLGLLQYAAITNMLLTMVIGICYKYIGSLRIGVWQLAVFAPIMVIVLLYVRKHLRETRDVDLNTVGQAEA